MEMSEIELPAGDHRAVLADQAEILELKVQTAIVARIRDRRMMLRSGK